MSATGKQNQNNENDERPSLFEVGFVRHHLAMAAGGTLIRRDAGFCASSQVLILTLSVLKTIGLNSHVISASISHF